VLNRIKRTRLLQHPVAGVVEGLGAGVVRKKLLFQKLLLPLRAA